MAVAAFAMAAVSPAAMKIESNFDVDDDGWVVTDFLTQGKPTFVPNYQPDSQNPGGFIRTDDRADWTSYQAPGKFLGNRSAAYGGTLAFDLRILDSDGLVYSLIEISDGQTTMQYRANPTAGAWQRYNILMRADAAWQLSTNGKSPGGAVTAVQMQTVLSNLQYLRIDADWLTGADQVDLDNVFLTDENLNAVPEPGTLGLVGAFGLALTAWRRARR